MSKGWDNATLKKLKALTGKGLSTSEIGKRLGMSKNAIVGKLNRLGWNAKAGGAVVSAPAKAEKKAESSSVITKVVEKITAKKTTAKAAPAAPKKEPAKATAKKTTTTKTGAKKTESAPKAKSAKATVAKAAEPKSNAKTSAKNLAMHQRIIQHSLEMANLKPNQCRWPIGDPDSEHFHFCGETVFVGKPYCYEHCKQAYQFTPPKKK
jgi:GcrA cell cycle regulator